MLRSASAGLAEHAKAPRSVQRPSAILLGVKTPCEYLIYVRDFVRASKPDLILGHVTQDSSMSLPAVSQAGRDYPGTGV